MFASEFFAHLRNRELIGSSVFIVENENTTSCTLNVISLNVVCLNIADKHYTTNPYLYNFNYQSFAFGSGCIKK